MQGNGLDQLYCNPSFRSPPGFIDIWIYSEMLYISMNWTMWKCALADCTQCSAAYLHCSMSAVVTTTFLRALGHLQFSPEIKTDFTYEQLMKYGILQLISWKIFLNVKTSSRWPEEYTVRRCSIGCQHEYSSIKHWH